MEKRTGWGTEYSAELRNGEWEYQAFTADKKVDGKRKLSERFECHKLLEKQDYVLPYELRRSRSNRHSHTGLCDQ